MPRSLDRFPSFVQLLRDRMVAGAEEYGDKNLDAPPDRLLRELQEELVDIAGWGYLLWRQVERLRNELLAAGPADTPRSAPSPDDETPASEP